MKARVLSPGPSLAQHDNKFDGALVLVTSVKSLKLTLPPATSRAGEWPVIVVVTSLAAPVAVAPLGGAENVTVGAVV